MTVDVAWMFDHIEAFGIMAGGFLALVIWGIRLEGKVLNSEKRLDVAEARITHNENQIENIESGLSKELNEVKQSLARIEGYLKARCDQGDCVGVK